ncbi:MAG: hypothetical protein AAFU73_05950 [Planctomycetota bacterium]
MPKRQPIRFLEPTLQRRMAAGVLTCVGVTAVVAGSCSIWSLHGLAVGLENDTQEVLASSIPFGLKVAGAALAVTLPLMTLMVLAATMPLVGAHHRIRTYLERVAAGEETGELSLRDGDPLQETADLINRTTVAARAATADRNTPEERAAA